MPDFARFFSWLPDRVVELAAARLPPNSRARYREEWLAHIHELPSSLSRLWHALGLFFGARDIARVLVLADGISAGIASQLRQSSQYRGPDRIEPKIELNVRLQNGGVLGPLLSRTSDEFRIEIGRPRLPDVDKKDLAKHLEEVEAKFPLHFLGRLPRGTAAHVFDDDAIDLLAEKREGLSLLSLTGAELALAEKLGRPVGIVLKSGLKGNDRERVLAQAQPI